MRSRYRRIRNALITVTVSITLAVPTAYLLAPHVQRWQRLRELDSADLALRERALNYVIHHARSDARVRHGAAQRLGEVDANAALLIFRALHEAGQAHHRAVLDAMFQRMAQADDSVFRIDAAELDKVGAWQCPPVPLDLWLRSTAMMLREPDPLARVLAVHRLADLHAAAWNQRFANLLQEALRDGDAAVRYAALLAAGELAGAAAGQAQRPALEAIVAAAARDDDPTIARDAWLILALLDPVSGFRADWQNVPPAVAQAILFAAVKTNPMHPQPALDALRDRDAPPLVRCGAAYALHMAHLGDLPREDEDALVAWRLALAAAPMVPPTLALGDELKSLTPASVAALHRGAPLIEHVEAIFAEDSPVPPLVQLAILEGLPVDRARIPIAPAMPDMLRLAAVAVTQNPQPDDLRQLFESPQSSLRDGACIVAAERFSKAQNADLIRGLLGNYNDAAKMSGAILSGLTGLHGEWLEEKAEIEPTWTVQQVMHLGLWMQGRMAKLDDAAPGMLVRDDLPQSTILLALLHKQRPEALEYLFNPRGPASAQLLELLDHYRWQRVLKRYLPGEAPPLWHWADESLKRFQIDVLRNWYLVNRHTIFTATRPNTR